LRHTSACPHDCPSTCALDIERIDARHIGSVRGAKDNTYTAGVICSKVARYRERIHHADRLTQPLWRRGPKGSRDFVSISWDDALDEVAEALLRVEREYGSESIWPYFYAGTMGRIMRDGIHRLRNSKKYSGQHSTICVTSAWNGFIAGTGRLAGVDPREMSSSDMVVIWGTNASSTQVNVMTHALEARRQRSAKIVVIDTYKNATAKQSDLFLCVRPGTDGALACGVMNILFRDGYADWDYLKRYTDVPEEFAQHIETRTPVWAESISGVPVSLIEEFAHLIGNTPRTFFRLGYGFSRQRNGAVNMHAALCIPTITGAWRYKGGGAFHNNGAIYHWNQMMIEGLDVLDSSIRVLDQSRIGEILTGKPDALHNGPPVMALLIQNTNPMVVAPDLNLVHRGFARDDLFVCVHEQFMTETAEMADIVLPATMFLEHDDIYQGGGHQHIIFGPKIIEPPGQCRSNHQVVCELAKRLGASHQGFEMTPRQLIDWTLRESGWGTLDALEQKRWIDCQPSFDDSHYIGGFAHEDGKFHLAPNWWLVEPAGFVPSELRPPRFPDHWPVIEEATPDMPFRLVTAPARHYLNSTFNETPTSVRREGQPTIMIHPMDATELGICDGQIASIGNKRGAIRIHAKYFKGLLRGVVIIESIWPNSAFIDGKGVNFLTGADPVAPVGGAAFHDNRIWIRAKN